MFLSLPFCYLFQFNAPLPPLSPRNIQWNSFLFWALEIFECSNGLCFEQHVENIRAENLNFCKFCKLLFAVGKEFFSFPFAISFAIARYIHEQVVTCPNHISIICLYVNFFLAKNQTVLNRMTRKYWVVIYFVESIFSHFGLPGNFLKVDSFICTERNRGA